MEYYNLHQPYDNSSSSEEENSTYGDTESNLDVHLHLLNNGDEGLIQAVEETDQQQDIIKSNLPHKLVKQMTIQHPSDPQRDKYLQCLRRIHCILLVQRFKQSKLMTLMSLKLF